MTTPRRPTTPNRRTTTQRGLGWDHQQQKRRLMARLVDGTPCPCLDTSQPGACGPSCPCRAAGRGLPMYRDERRNVDGKPLEADHIQARALGGKLAKRLMLAVCNRSRGLGTRPHAGNPPWWSRDWTGTT